MAKSGLRVVKRPKLKPGQSLRDIRAELIKELQPVAAQHTRQRNAVVAGWRHKPQFRSIIAITPNQIRLEVFIRNELESLGKYGGNIADLWRWHNVGTGLHGPHKRRYAIYPRFKTVLRFFIGGVEIFAKYVDSAKRQTHPGMRGKKYNERINKRLQPRLIAAIRRGYNKGFKRAFR